MAMISTARPPVAGLSQRFSVLIVLVALAALLFGVERFGSRILVSLLAQAIIVSALAFGVGLLIRVSGLVSFGHAAPFGLGAYGTVYALSGAAPLPPEIGLPLVVMFVTLVFFLIGLVISRLEGVAFSMLTLALGQAAFVAATKFRSLTGGGDGVIIDMPRQLYGVHADVLQSPYGMFVVGVALLTLVYFALSIAECTQLGRLAVAIRENEERVRFLGYRTRVLKAGVFAVSASLAALGGVLFALYQGFVSPEILHWSFSGSALIMAILGGTSALWGPVAGAFAFFFLKDGLADVTTHWLAVLGITLILVTIAWPSGISGAVQFLLARVPALFAKGKGR